MIITVTPNVAIDQTVVLDRLIPGEVQRAQSVRYNAGGKGVNVSSCLADWGLRSRATGFLGRDNAVVFEELCALKNIEDAFVRVNGSSRVNIKIVDNAGTTDINLPGPHTSREALAALESTVEKRQGKSGLAVLAGSLPSGCPETLYAAMVEMLSHIGFRVLLDTSGQALICALGGSVLPYALKPNIEELGQWAGCELSCQADVLREGHRLLEKGVRLVVVSMGGEGALFLSAQASLLARTSVPDIASTVGAGDAMVAGIIAALHENGDAPLNLERAARLGTAFAAGKLTLHGPNLPPKPEVESLAAQVDIKQV